MNRNLVICGLVLIAGITALAGADRIVSSIVTDGSSWTQSSLTGKNLNYHATFFTSDPSVIIRQLGWDGAVHTRTSITAVGSFGVDEFSSSMPNRSTDRFWCLFSEDPADNRYNEVGTSGLMRSAVYDSEREVGETTASSLTSLNGSGMVFLAKRAGNESYNREEESIVSGRMNVSENVRTGGDSGWRF